jgi:ABC-type multidrug transport system fused ATPase/permease subunit
MQESVVFEGKNVRKQLDPEGLATDAQIFDALEATQLGKLFPRPAPGQDATAVLDADLPAMSHGQRQLFCIARAILRRAKIVLCDEASSSLDSASDEIVQHAIRTAFKTCTVLTIAHRINTILDSDKVLCMDRGVVAEYDEPQVLLKNPNSMFAQLLSKHKANVAGEN